METNTYIIVLNILKRMAIDIAIDALYRKQLEGIKRHYKNALKLLGRFANGELEVISLLKETLIASVGDKSRYGNLERKEEIAFFEGRERKHV